MTGTIELTVVHATDIFVYIHSSNKGNETVLMTWCYKNMPKSCSSTYFIPENYLKYDNFVDISSRERCAVD